MTHLLRPKELRTRIDLAVRALQTHTFDTIAFRGMSGAFLGPQIAAFLDKEMILVRKPHDDTHSFYNVEGFKGARRYIIVDDFISLGGTKRAIIEAVSKFAPDANFVGLLPVLRIRDYMLEHSERHNTPYPLE